MEAFTLVLLIGWIILMGCFVAMYFLDRAVKKADAEPPRTPEQGTAQRR